jgi:enoyl-CoA hydratase
MPINLTIADGIAEILFDHAPVNAFDTKGWESIPALINQASFVDNKGAAKF